jgi:acetyl esterase/lipase
MSQNHQPPPRPPLVLSSTVEPSDTSTSVVVEPAGPQISRDQARPGLRGAQVYNDVVYARRGTTPDGDGDGVVLDLRLDLLVPPGPGPKPLVIYVPGGGFVFSDKAQAPDLRAYVAEQGFAVAGIEYRTSRQGATYVEGVADAKAAVRFLRAHAGEYGIDADRIAVWGESAGGYMAAMVGVTAGQEQFETSDNDGQSSEVQAVVDKFGPSDLSKLAADFDEAARRAAAAPENPFATYVFGPGTGKSLLDSPEIVARADPAAYVSAGTPPFLLMHGSADNLVSPSQTLLLHTALRAAEGVESTRYVLTGAKHGDMTFMGDPAAGAPWSTRETMGYIVEFLGRHLKG